MGCRRLLPSLSVLFLLLVDCSALIPLIGWSNSDAFASVKGDHFTGANEFIYDAEMDSVDIIVVFKSPELSFDALSKYGGTFGGDSALASLQSELRSSKSSVWAGIEGSVASDLVSTLSFILDTQPRIIAGSYGVARSKLLVVELTSTPEDWDSLADQDYVISDVISAIQSLPGSPTYAALYTSSHTHMPRQKHREVRRRSAREAESFRLPQQTDADFEPLCAIIRPPSDDGTTNNTNREACLLFCLTNGNISRGNSSESVAKGGGMELLNVTGVQIIDGSCNDTGVASVTVRVDLAGESENSLEFKFRFPRGICSSSGKDSKGTTGSTDTINCGFWSMEVFVSDDSEEEQRLIRNTEEPRIFPKFSVPVGAAYACGNNSLNVFKPRNSSTGEKYDYKFYGIQAQAYGGIFNNSNPNSAEKRPPSFGSVYNCQSYFTTVPLMGVVTVVILLLILYCSTVFLFSIRTLDRFDDPRAPTITVENLH